MNNSEILICQNPDGNIKIDVRLEEETVCLTAAQLCKLFQRRKPLSASILKTSLKKANSSIFQLFGNSEQPLCSA